MGDIMNGKQLILASKSPRRDELLTMAGIEHTVFAADADESAVVYEKGEPEKYVEQLSRLKAECAFEQLRSTEEKNCSNDERVMSNVSDLNSSGSLSGRVILSADTVVYSCTNMEVLGKPADRDDAYRMLRMLSGGMHRVITGFSLMYESGGKAELVSRHVSTEVWFRELSDEEIYGYIDSSEPFDKAGAYGIQEGASVFVTRINGDYFNIVGLPVESVYVMLRDLKLN